MDFTRLTIKTTHKLLKSRQISVTELVQASLKRIQESDPKIHAFLKVTEEQAIEQAKEAQKRFDEQLNINPLLGIPMAHKDMFCTEGVETTASSNILKGYVPPYSATVVERLNEAGAVCLGKLNCDAFAHGASTENSDFGPTRNPYNTDFVPGGSSGGSAVAVCASQVLFATGTDTGGSIRQPASFTNIVGLKPTYGRVSRYGVIAMASSIDCPGPFAKTVEDCAMVLKAMAGSDPHDSTSSKRPVPDYEAELGKDIKGWKIGVPNEFFAGGISPEVEKTVRAAILKFEQMGAKVEGVDLPYIGYSLAAYYIIIPSEISSNLARYDGIKYGFSVERDAKFHPADLLEVYEHSRGKGFGDEAKRRIMLGTYALSAGYYDAYYKKAQQVRELIRRDFIKAFEKYDLLLGPVSPTPPFKLGEKSNDPLAMYLSDIYTTPCNLSGNPAISVPCGFIDLSRPVGTLPSSGEGKSVGVPPLLLPVGLQIIGTHFAEDKILQAAYAYEQATKFYEKTPKI